MNEMIQSHLLDHGQLNYEHFIIDFIAVLVSYLFDSLAKLVDVERV